MTDTTTQEKPNPTEEKFLELIKNQPLDELIKMFVEIEMVLKPPFEDIQDDKQKTQGIIDHWQHEATTLKQIEACLSRCLELLSERYSRINGFREKLITYEEGKLSREEIEHVFAKA